ncbi:hypothetical protein DdX_08181 [Ditylenchus destructor]|uniref:Uncharacterized protein n=1 Tax=Ditylenchus destructor TaxID=166010 RepID=A0AAD4R777_9BILA|nr:hypothetical protein DdX_08181 [Ditylenchus destructor]
MGQLKKYEAHTRYPCCCCAVDVKKSVLTLSIAGLAFCVFIAIVAGANCVFSSDSKSNSDGHSFANFNVAMTYAVAYGAIIFGVLTNRPSYLTIFLIVNGFMVAFMSCLLAFMLVLVMIDPASLLLDFDYPSASVEVWQLKQYLLSYNLNMTQPLEVEVNATQIDEAPNVVVISEQDASHYGAIFLFSITLSIWIATILIQGLVFHAYRSLKLRKQFEYNPYNAKNLSSPITMQHAGTNGVTGGNNYISSIKGSLFPKRI